jgi:hypothetical protein
MNGSPKDWKEARRFQAWHLVQQGWSQRQIAEALGVSEGAASHWITPAREEGPEALRHRACLGAPCRLTADQLARLPELLHHVGRLLNAICSSPQKPVGRDPNTPPPPLLADVKTPGRPLKGAQAQQQTIGFIDESGLFYPLAGVIRIYAPAGHTTILREWWTRDHLSAIRAMSPEGKLYFSCPDTLVGDQSTSTWRKYVRCACLLRIASGDERSAGESRRPDLFIPPRFVLQA